MQAKPQALSLRKAYRFWQLVVVKIRFNLRSEASQSYLSYAWWILEPLLMMAVFFVVFAIFLNRGTGDFVSFLLCGLVPWLWFARSVGNSSRSIVEGRGLISQTYLPKPFFPLVIVGQDVVKQFFVFTLLIVFLVLFGYAPDYTWLWLIAIVIAQLLLIMSVTLVVSFIVPFARDLQYLVTAVLTMMMLGSGIFYSYKEVLLPEHRQIFLLNPMANLIVSYRRVLLEGSVPFVGSLLVIMAVSIMVISIMFLLMKRYDNALTLQAIE